MALQDIGFKIVGKRTISSKCVKVTIKRLSSTLDNDAHHNEFLLSCTNSKK